MPQKLQTNSKAWMCHCCVHVTSSGSFASPALATIIKERIFRDAAKRLGGGQQLDVLVVNAYCSTAQVMIA